MNGQYKRELSDTEALVAKGVRPAQLKTSDEPSHSARGSADLAVSGPGTGRFLRSSGPNCGNESLSKAVGIAGCEE